MNEMMGESGTMFGDCGRRCFAATDHIQFMINARPLIFLFMFAETEFGHEGRSARCDRRLIMKWNKRRLNKKETQMCALHILNKQKIDQCFVCDEFN